METSKKKAISNLFPSFRSPFCCRNTGARLGIGAFAGMALLPPALRDPILGAAGRLAGRGEKRSPSCAN